MRSVVLLIVTLVLLAGGLALFLNFQSAPPAVRNGPPASTTPPSLASTTQDGEHILGPGENVWIQTYDKDSGALLNEFRAERYEPPKNDVVHVARPEARFYSSNGQVLTLSASYGDVVMPQTNAKPQNLNSLDSGPPTRGTLHDVTLGLLNEENAARPSITCRIPVLAFDNESLKLNTIQTQIDGREVLADRVPVTVRGDYEFDGEGLTIRWNARDQRLEYLEVTHGRRLLVKDPSAFGGLPTASDDRRDQELLIALADANADAAAKVAAEESERRAHRRAVAATRRAAVAQSGSRGAMAYHAVFHDDVRLREGTAEVGSADRLTATFSFDKPDAAPKSPPDEATPRLSPTPSSTTEPATRRARRTPVSQPAATQPQQPVELRWTGKLTITPVPLAEAGLKSAADSVIGFEGNPAKLSRGGSGVVAKKIAASTEGERFTAVAAPGEQVTLTDPSGLTLTTESLDFVGNTATLKGPSSVTLPLPVAEGEAAANVAPPAMNVRWSDKATLTFDAAQGGRVIRRAGFDGAVAVTHPDFRLNAATLGLTFDPKSGSQKPIIDRVEAIGGVVVAVRGEDGAERQIKADALVASARVDAAGAMWIAGVDAQGNVTVQDGPRALSADKLSAAFAEAAAGSDDKVAGKTTPVAAAIETLRAAGGVKLEDGPTRAEADELTLKTEADHQTIRLKGNPALVGDGASRLTGNTINVRSDGATAGVAGPGKLVGLATPKPGQAAQPVEITWSDSFDYNAAENRANLIGNVAARATGSDGAALSATGKRMRVDLATAAAKPTTTQKATGAVPLEGFGDKRIAGVTLSDDVQLASVLTDPANPQKVLRRAFAFAPEVRVALDERGDPAGVTIPSAGRLLVDDPQQAAAAPASGQPAKAIEGAIAVQWLKSMTYDPAKRNVTLDGGVTVVYQRLGQDPLRLESQRMIADVNPAPGARPVDRVRVEGGVVVSNKQVRMTAGSAVYDPGNNHLTAAVPVSSPWNSPTSAARRAGRSRKSSGTCRRTARSG
jgi:lipopolysaccharide export system protein LptA